MHDAVCQRDVCRHDACRIDVAAGRVCCVDDEAGASEGGVFAAVALDRHAVGGRDGGGGAGVDQEPALEDITLEVCGSEGVVEGGDVGSVV